MQNNRGYSAIFLIARVIKVQKHLQLIRNKTNKYCENMYTYNNTFFVMYTPLKIFANPPSTPPPLHVLKMNGKTIGWGCIDIGD